MLFDLQTTAQFAAVGDRIQQVKNDLIVNLEEPRLSKKSLDTRLDKLGSFFATKVQQNQTKRKPGVFSGQKPGNEHITKNLQVELTCFSAMCEKSSCWQLWHKIQFKLFMAMGEIKETMDLNYHMVFPWLNILSHHLNDSAASWAPHSLVEWSHASLRLRPSLWNFCLWQSGLDQKKWTNRGKIVKNERFLHPGTLLNTAPVS